MSGGSRFRLSSRGSVAKSRVNDPVCPIETSFGNFDRAPDGTFAVTQSPVVLKPFTPRVFSGVQPTGNLHLGNYLGAIKRFADLQASHECVYCVVDMHAITQGHDPLELRRATHEVTAAYIAAGIDLCPVTLSPPVPASPAPQGAPPVARQSRLHGDPLKNHFLRQPVHNAMWSF